MAKKKYDYSREAILAKRKFPIIQTIIIAFLVVLQIALTFLLVIYKTFPKDIIDDYSIYVTPKDDGTLDIEYRFTWTALDTDEPLTKIYIGVANPEFNYYSNFSENIETIKYNVSEDGLCYAVIIFKEPYIGGDTFDFSFKINQRDMLCEKDGKPFYEFVPGWFNAIRVNHFSFNWKKSPNITVSNAMTRGDEWLSWEGELDYGEYVIMNVTYNEFDAPTTKYNRFNDDGAYNELKDDTISMRMMLALFILLIFMAEVFLIDSHVSYIRGRGFLHGYGHPVHTYGRSNPRYVAAHTAHGGSSGRGGRGGGCACACACACAGGGRAGCSQKDTYKFFARAEIYVDGKDRARTGKGSRAGRVSDIRARRKLK